MLFAFSKVSVKIIKLTNKVEFDYQVDGHLSKNDWYLMMSNHLSWLDIVILTEFAADRIPAPKFFLKKELIWLPFIGVGAWALDMPFMQRYSSAFIAKNPHLKGKDIATTKKSCEKFKLHPTTVINFVEGSRFTAEKHRLRNSPYQKLLPPKAGGIAFTLAAMGELFNSVLDVTILYPKTSGSAIVALLSGKLKTVVLRVKVHAINNAIIGDYFNDEDFRMAFQSWLNQKWQEKDQQINDMDKT
ncbi:acyltransferase [Paraglaciecola hydrolytica]|uniref:Acyltransferase n=2 Tax=Paraglaciecola hydrolytica TaxID=1799789 RepID=A0A136A5J7_9ALTE|nr:acyltransferase [Paraglaciecola hydrolytica]